MNSSLLPPDPSLIPKADYLDAYKRGYAAVAHERPLYAPRNPYEDEDSLEHIEWEEGAIAGGILDDYTNGVRSDGRERV